MSPGERVEQRLLALEGTLFGIHEAGGLVSQVEGLRREFRKWREEETNRRDAAARAQVMALGASCVSLLGVIVVLIGIVAGQ